MTIEIGGQPVPLPPGWQVEIGQEGTAVVNGQSLPGIYVNLSYPATNVTTKVFVPYQVLSNLAAVSQQLNKRITDLQAVQGLTHGG